MNLLISKSRAEKLFLFLVCIASPLTDIKIGNIQVIEFIVGGSLLLLGIAYLLGHSRLRISIATWNQYGPFLWALGGILIGVLISQFQDFYPPEIRLGFLQRPPWISISRVLQMCLVLSAGIMVGEIILQRPKMLSFFIKWFIYWGTVIASYAVLSWLLISLFDVSIGGAYNSGGLTRAKGTFVEGGPFGLYLVGLILFALFLGKGADIPKTKRFLCLAIQTSAFLLSLSKAGIAALLLTSMVLFFTTLRSARLKIPAFLLVGAILALCIPKLVEGIRTYYGTYIALNSLRNTQQDDTNIFMGRMIGLRIVPKMIMEHPLIGIGLGNYPLLRNAPVYVGNMPKAKGWDLNGLGMLGYVAELGIPLSILLCWGLLRPYLAARRMDLPGPPRSLGLFQMIAHLLGVQLTFLYPWLISAGVWALVAAKQRGTVENRLS